MDLLFFTNASGESAFTPITGGATRQLNHTGGHLHMDHHTGHTTYGASSHREVRAMADVIAEIATHLPTHLSHVFRVWFVVDATVYTHLLLRIARQPLHKATATSLGTQALLLWRAPYTSHDRSYHYPNPIQHLARVLGDTDSAALFQELQEKLTVPLATTWHYAQRTCKCG